MRSLRIKLDEFILGMIVCFPLLYYIKSFVGGEPTVGIHHLYDFTLLFLIFLSLINSRKGKINILVFPIFLFLFLSVLTFVLKGTISSGFFGYYHRWFVFLFSILFGISLAQKGEVNKEQILKILNVFVYLCLFFGFLQLIIGDMPYLNGRYRLSGQYGHRPVVYSLNLFVCLVIYAYRIHKLDEGSYYSNYIIFSLILVLIYLTYTRLTLLITLTFLFFLIKINWRYKAILVGVFAGLVAILVIQTNVLHRFELLFQQFQDLSEYHGDGSLLLRIKVTVFMMGKLAENWLFGIGPGMFNQVWAASFGEAGMSPHFGLLTIIVENGLIGSFVLLGFIFLLFKKVINNCYREKYVAKIFIFSFLLYFFASTFNTPLYKTELVFVLNTLLFYTLYKDLLIEKNVRYRIIKK